MAYPQRSQSSTSIENINPNINFDFEENSPFQEGSMSKTFQRPDKSFFQEPRKLRDLVNKGNLVHRYLPKQRDIDKILKVIQRKVLKGTHLLVEIKEIQVGYVHSSYFKDLFLYLSQNRLPSSKSAIKRIETLAEKYIPLDSLLFKLIPEKEIAVLVVPEACVDRIITLYYSSLFTGHQGVIKTYLTISDNFFIPNLIHYLRSYIKGCHLCQLNKNYLWDTLEIDWKEVTVTFNGNKIDLPRVVIIKFQDKFKVRRLMNREPLLFHLMLKQGII